MKKICHISTAHFPNDDRIFYKECVSLDKLGYEVFFIVRSPKDETVRNIRLIALPEFKSRSERMLFGPRKAYKLARKIDAEIYHFHDPELIPAGLKLKKLGKKVIYDVHENVYDQLESKTWLGPFVRIVQRIYLQFERKAVRHFDSIITATETIEHHFKEYYPEFKAKLRVLRNFSILELIDHAEPLIIEEEKKKLIYMGGLSRIRGIKEIIMALERMETPPVLLLFGNWESEDYKRECESLKGWQNVNYMGFKKLEEIYPYLKASDVGLALLYPEKNYLRSLPVKAFEYMACGKPMILSDFEYWKEIFANCAIFVNPLDPRDIAEKLAGLLKDEKLMSQLGRNGRKSIEDKYSWEAEAGNLADIYSNLLSNANKTAE